MAQRGRSWYSPCLLFALGLAAEVIAGPEPAASEARHRLSDDAAAAPPADCSAITRIQQSGRDPYWVAHPDEFARALAGCFAAKNQNSSEAETEPGPASLTIRDRRALVEGPSPPPADPCGVGGASIAEGGDVIHETLQNNQDCTWTLSCSSSGTCIEGYGTCPQVPLVTFSAFDTEAGYDKVFIYDADNTDGTPSVTLDGTSVPDPFRATVNVAVVRYTSDSSANGQGFTAEMSCVDGPPPPPVDCQGSFESCTTECEAAATRVWVETAAPSNGGAACPSPAACTPGEGLCPWRPLLIPTDAECSAGWTPPGEAECSLCPPEFCGTRLHPSDPDWDTRVLGCTDPAADNYNPSAEIEDGVCSYETSCSGGDAYTLREDNIFTCFTTPVCSDGSCGPWEYSLPAGANFMDAGKYTVGDTTTELAFPGDIGDSSFNGDTHSAALKLSDKPQIDSYSTYWRKNAVLMHVKFQGVNQNYMQGDATAWVNCCAGRAETPDSSNSECHEQAGRGEATIDTAERGYFPYYTCQTGGAVSSADDGNRYDDDGPVHISVAYAVFENNIAKYGGAIWQEDGELNVRYALFEGNQAVHGGGVYLTYKSAGTLWYTAFKSNEATLGSAIYVTQGTMAVNYGLFSANTGKAIYVPQAGLTMSYVHATGNSGLALESTTAIQAHVRSVCAILQTAFTMH